MPAEKSIKTVASTLMKKRKNTTDSTASNRIAQTEPDMFAEPINQSRQIGGNFVNSRNTVSHFYNNTRSQAASVNQVSYNKIAASMSGKKES
jgi:hypothetical protein